MKPKLATLAAIFIALITPLSAQSLIPKTDVQRIAEGIDSRQIELINHIETELRVFYETMNQSGKQQQILDALGTNAAAAVQRYAMMRGLVLQLKPTANIPAPNPEIFVVNENGTVTYVAPPEPEPPTPPAP